MGRCFLRLDFVFSVQILRAGLWSGTFAHDGGVGVRSQGCAEHIGSIN